MSCLKGGSIRHLWHIFTARELASVNCAGVGAKRASWLLVVAHTFLATQAAQIAALATRYSLPALSMRQSERYDFGCDRNLS
jgi:hypothetical protein